MRDDLDARLVGVDAGDASCCWSAVELVDATTHSSVAGRDGMLGRDYTPQPKNKLTSPDRAETEREKQRSEQELITGKRAGKNTRSSRCDASINWPVSARETAAYMHPQQGLLRPTRKCTSSSATVVRAGTAVRSRVGRSGPPSSCSSELLTLASVASLRQPRQDLVDRRTDDKLLLGEGTNALRVKADRRRVWVSGLISGKRVQTVSP
jgi:hypothetical protein